MPLETSLATRSIPGVNNKRRYDESVTLTHEGIERMNSNNYKCSAYNWILMNRERRTRVTLSATLKLISQKKMRIVIETGVPGVGVRMPAPKPYVTVDRSTRDRIWKEANNGSIPSVIRNGLEALDISVPPLTYFRRTVKHCRKAMAGGKSGVESGTEMLSTVLKDKGIALTWIPRKQLAVIVPQGNADMFHHCTLMGLDEKFSLFDKDSTCVTGINLMSASKSPLPASKDIISIHTVVLAIAPTRNTFIVKTLLKTIKRCCKCGTDCIHPLVSVPYNNAGGFHMERTCHRRSTWCSRMLAVTDEFSGSLRAFREFNIRYLLCDFHLCENLMEKLSALGIRDSKTMWSVVLCLKNLQRTRSVSELRAEQKRTRTSYLQCISNVTLRTKVYKYLENKTNRLGATDAALTDEELTTAMPGMSTNNSLESMWKLMLEHGNKFRKFARMDLGLTGITGILPNGHEITETSFFKHILRNQHDKVTYKRLGRTSVTVPSDSKVRLRAACLSVVNSNIIELDDDMFMVDRKSCNHPDFRKNAAKVLPVASSSACKKILHEHRRKWSEESKRTLARGCSGVNLSKKTCTCMHWVLRGPRRDYCACIKACIVMRTYPNPVAFSLKYLTEYLYHRERCKTGVVRKKELMEKNQEYVRVICGMQWKRTTSALKWTFIDMIGKKKAEAKDIIGESKRAEHKLRANFPKKRHSARGRGKRINISHCRKSSRLRRAMESEDEAARKKRQKHLTVTLQRDAAKKKKREKQKRMHCQTSLNTTQSLKATQVTMADIQGIKDDEWPVWKGGVWGEMKSSTGLVFTLYSTRDNETPDMVALLRKDIMLPSKDIIKMSKKVLGGLRGLKGTSKTHAQTLLVTRAVRA